VQLLLLVIPDMDPCFIGKQLIEPAIRFTVMRYSDTKIPST